MENQLTEFVSLTCYGARRLFKESAVPQGVIEKIIVVARHLGIHIEGTEVRVSPRGQTATWQGSTLVIEPKLVDLKNLTSKYFNKRASHGVLVFEASPHFIDNVFPAISRKDYIGEYEGANEALLQIWQLPGGLENLVYLSLSGNNALSDLVGDIEHILVPLREYIRKEIYLGTKSRVPSHQVLGEIRGVAAALRDKLSILHRGNDFRRRLEGLPKTVYINRLLNDAEHLPPQCLLWDLFEWLAGILVSVAETVLQMPRDLPLFRDEVDRTKGEVISTLENIVRDMYTVTGRQFILPKGDFDTRLMELFDLLDQQTLAWCRAMLGKYDTDYFDAHRHNRWVTGIRNIVVAYDVKRSTRILDKLFGTSSKNLPKEIDIWRSKLYSIPANWSVLFDGVLKSEGDQVIAFFDRNAKGSNSMSLSLIHVDYLETTNPHKDKFRLGLKAGIGAAAVFLAAGQENSPPINHIYHAVEDLTVVTPEPDQWKSSALALDDFVKEHEQIRTFCTQEIQFRDGLARALDYQQIAEEFVSGTKGV